MQFDGMNEKIVPSLLQTNIIFVIEFATSFGTRRKRRSPLKRHGRKKTTQYS